MLKLTSTNFDNFWGKSVAERVIYEMVGPYFDFQLHLLNVSAP